MSSVPEPVEFPPRILLRIARVQRYHARSKHRRQPRAEEQHPVDLNDPPSPYRVFGECPQVDLPRTVLELPADTLDVLRYGADSLPDGLPTCSHDLLTLATWLYMAAGITQRYGDSENAWYLRSCPSAGALYPFEIYIAALAIDGLEPGLYHFSPWKFHLRKLRDGAETLARFTRGRPELRFLRTSPGALLVSTNFWRSAWRYGLRGYRYALLDAGHMVQNLATAAAGLGARIITRLRVHEAAMRELIGVSEDAPFDQAESVQAIIGWAEHARQPYTPSLPPARPLPPIARPALSRAFVDVPDIGRAQRDCAGPGLPLVEVRPPLTELTAIATGLPKIPVAAGPPDPALPLQQAFVNRRSPGQFRREPLPLRYFIEINWIAFRGGTFWPLRPAGPHLGAVRPFWFVHAIDGIESGLWYYDPVEDGWSLIRGGDFRDHARRLCIDQDIAADSAAVGFMFANLQALMSETGPDVYRLAHLEAGAAGQRISLAATALGFAANGIGSFFDDDIRRFLGLGQSGWEPLYAIAIGQPA